MALRSKALIGVACLALLPCVASASYTVRHDHLRGGGTGTLAISETGISFTESGKHKDHSREWHWTDIQQLTLGSGKLSILTYEDVTWQLGRDREYDFDEVPNELAAAAPLLEAHLHQRFVEAVPQKLAPAWQMDARLQKKFSGSDGALVFAPGQVSFQTKRAGDTRTWRIDDIDSISSSGPYDLTITTYERAGVSRADRTDFHFQLKERMPEDRYNALWREVNQAKGLKDLNTLLPAQGEHHEARTR